MAGEWRIVKFERNESKRKRKEESVEKKYAFTLAFLINEITEPQRGCGADRCTD